jgi:hypothetical protein
VRRIRTPTQPRGTDFANLRRRAHPGPSKGPWGNLGEETMAKRPILTSNDGHGRREFVAPILTRVGFRPFPSMMGDRRVLVDFPLRFLSISR